MHRPTAGDRIYLLTEGVFGRIISLGAYASRVEFSAGGIYHDIVVENDEFIILDELHNEEEWQD